MVLLPTTLHALLGCTANDQQIQQLVGKADPSSIKAYSGTLSHAERGYCLTTNALRRRRLLQLRRLRPVFAIQAPLGIQGAPQAAGRPSNAQRPERP